MADRAAVLASCDALARGEGALDLALGEVLLRLFDGDRLLQLGYARQVDYARERLGVKPGLMYRWMRLARGLATRPVLRSAVEGGVVSGAKACVVMDAATGEREAPWTVAAAALPLGELQRRVEGEGYDAGCDAVAFETIVLTMTAEQRDVLDLALLVASFVVGPAAPRWQKLEAIAMEWLGAHGEFAASGARAGPVDVRAALGGSASSAPSVVEPVGSTVPDSARALDERARALVRQRDGRDEQLGRLLVRVRDERLYRDLGYEWFETYCGERLGMAPRSVRERVWLERRLQSLPSLRAEFRAGRISRTKAMLVAESATPADVEQRIAEVSGTTVQQAQAESDAERDRRDREAGKFRLWGAKEAMETIVGAIRAGHDVLAAVHRAESAPRPQWTARRSTDGEVLAAMAEHFVRTWAPQLREWRRRAPTSRRELLARHGGLCAVPGCSRAATDGHHVVYRSRGGSDRATNLLALCRAHHLRGIHKGVLSVEGDAGRRLVWHFHATGEVYETHGADDVRRVAFAGRPRRPEIREVTMT
jgi:hypothetical protein